MTPRAMLWTIVIAALMLRVIAALGQPTTLTYQAGGGDDGWYWINGRALASGVTTTEIDGVQIDVSRLAPPPLYLLVIGVPQQFLPQDAALISVRLLQALISTATVVLVYGITRQIAASVLTGRESGGGGSAALLAGALIAFSPAFIVESAQITTETLFIFLLAAGMFAYLRALTPAQPQARLAYLLLAAVLFGLATLTRAVFLAFPLALALYLVLLHGIGSETPRRWRAIRAALSFFALYAAVVGTWTAYNLARWDRLVIAGEGLASFLYIGATGWDDPAQVDQRLADDLNADVGDPPTQSAITGAAANAITADIRGYLSRRAGELIGALLQPHGTAYYPGASLRDLLVGWARDDRSFDGLIDVMRGDAFAPKAAIYAFHYVTLTLGVVGIWRARRARRLALPLIGCIGYTLLVHFFLLALPRYLFPTMILWAVFAGKTFVNVVESRKSKVESFDG